MAEFKLGRIRFVWKGNWTTSTQYYVDDVVRYGGRTYICQVGHTSDSDFYTDLDYNPTKWNVMTDGQEWKGDWSTSTFYKENDVVKYGGLLYIANNSHTSDSQAGSGAPGAETTTGLEANQSDWTLYAEGLDWKGDWATTTRYKVNDLVKYGGITYVCNTGHTSESTASDGLESDQSYWDEFNQGLEYKGDWSAAGGTRYKVNDVVKRGAGLWICTGAHTSTTDFPTDQASYWDEFAKGFEFQAAWSDATAYQIGDVVSYGGNQYIAKTNHTNSNPLTGSSDWDLFNEGFSFQSAWDINTDYKIGEVVTLNGYTYIASTDSPSISLTVTASDNGTNLFTTSDTSDLVVNQAVRFSGTTFGNVFTNNTYYIKGIGSPVTFTISETPGGNTFNPATATGSMTATIAAIPPNVSYWSRLTAGISWQGEWLDDREYVIGDAVRLGNNVYICILAHRSEGDDGSSIGAEGGGAANSKPDVDNGTYWNLLSIGSETSVLVSRGDLVYFGGAGPARLPIGTEGQVLRAGTLDPEWVTLGQVDHTYYVAPNGTDLPAPTHGVTLDKPWKTIRYACEQVENGPRNLNAKQLLERNRVFLQKEVSSYIDAQIAANAAPFSSAFDYHEYKCERDIGFVIDALIYDISHGGNVKTRGAANSFVGALFESENEAYPNLSSEKEESIAAYNYLVTVMTNVLDQTAPAVAYQNVSDDSTAIAAQYTNSSITAESGVTTTITSLMTIITNALDDEDASRVPARYAPNNLINIQTGQYNEILPIIVPEQTCVLGAELRSTNVRPDLGGSPQPEDSYYSVGALGRLETVVENVITGTTVTPTSGNAESQDQTYPTADTPEATVISRLVRTIQQNIDFRLGTINLAKYPDPVGYNSGYLSGYGDSRKNITYNKEFFKKEVTAYITENYPNVKYSKTKCQQDVGYIIDALTYDLTYGGNSQTIIAGSAYFDGPGGALAIDSTEKAATIAAYGYLKLILIDASNNTAITPLQNDVPQFRGTAGSAAAATAIGASLDIIIDIITNGTDSVPNITVTSITGTDTLVTGSAHGLGVGDSFVPRSTSNGLTTDVKYWVVNVPSSTEFKVSTTFGGSAATLTNGTGLTIVGNVIDYPAATNAVSSTTALITAAETLDAQQETLVTATTNYITANYPSLSYNSAKCERDTRLILEAVMFDFMLGNAASTANSTNFQTLKAALAYLRSTASDVYDEGQKQATIDAYENLATVIAGDTATYLNSDADAAARTAVLLESLVDVIYSGSTEGSICATSERNRDYAWLKLEENRDFIVAEVTAWIADTYTDTATDTTASTNVITISNTSWLRRNTAIRFSGTTFGGIATDTTYYVYEIVDGTTFKIATARNATSEITLTTASGSMTVDLYYSSSQCERDVSRYIDALRYDIKIPGNYKSLYAARYYANSVKGSLEEDMYYLRDSTGVRDQTLEGLSGDLLAVNAYNTSRVSAGAYCSLDPGWGPADYRAWIINRSPYVQGVTTIGTACIGQKIDGALHNGGNDSIVSNDFTQVLSDGIGAWVTNNGRAELVSVFTYYNHIGYLCEAGGRIRGTNGNNSYGDFGAVAEGFDTTETPDTAIVDNKFVFKATVNRVNTNSSAILNFEFENAGIDYTTVDYTITGGGTGAVVEQDDIRDGGVFQVRMLDLVDDSTNAPEADGNLGGFGYVTNSNTSQGGTTTQITLAAVDGETSTAYIGMKIFLTGGTGNGQVGIVDTYNSGTKVATVTKPSDGTAGWDHTVPATAIVAPDASTTYTIEPTLSFTSPTFTAAANTLATSGDWRDAVFGATTGVYTITSGYTYSGSTGTGASFTVIRNGFKYEVSSISGGTDYVRLETITIPGDDLGGATPANDLVITITAVNSADGSIDAFDYQDGGDGFVGRYVAVKDGSNQGAYSDDGETWTTMTLPSNTAWRAVASGYFNDGSTVANTSRFVAIASGGTTNAYSEDGISWSAGGALPASATWNDIAFGEDKFVAIAINSAVVAVSGDGQIWDQQGTLPSTGYTRIAYGQGIFVAIKPSSQEMAWSDDGVTWTQVATGLPASSAWSDIAYGKNTWVVVASDSNSGATSTTGKLFTAMTMGSPDSTDPAGYQRVNYGQGVFVASAWLTGLTGYSYVVSSENGLKWDDRALPDGGGTMAGYNAVAFGNPSRTGKWVALNYDSGNHVVTMDLGSTAQARPLIADEKIYAINIIDPGSRYTSAPTMTIVDPSNTFEAPVSVRIGDGVLANPSFKNRGSSYETGSATVDTGDGYADFFQPGSFVGVRQITSRPITGSNVEFSHLSGRYFKLVQVVTFQGSYDGAYTAFYQVSPELTVSEAPLDGTTVTTRLRYSQVRLTGHDFLDIGTGNLTETNYPGTPTQNPVPAQETQEGNGGRVFYTSTDQDGNFRVGDLFSVEQSTGVATLNADAFNIAGLQELNLGNVTLGGGSATITEFSTDPFFTADSDNIVPTQRAIKAYIASQIGGGGASLNVNSVIAGSIQINSNQITTTSGTKIKMNAVFDFTGGVTGLPIAFNYFLL